MVLLDTETPGTSREIYSEDADGETRTRNPWITNPVLTKFLGFVSNAIKLLLTELVGQCRNILPLAFSALTSLQSVNTGKVRAIYSCTDLPLS